MPARHHQVTSLARAADSEHIGLQFARRCIWTVHVLSCVLHCTAPQPLKSRSRWPSRRASDSAQAAKGPPDATLHLKSIVVQAAQRLRDKAETCCGCRDGDSAQAAMAPGPAPDATTHLETIVVQDPDGTVYDLSAPFSPERLQYASIVPEQTDTVMLCLVAMQGTSLPACLTTSLWALHALRKVPSAAYCTCLRPSVEQPETRSQRSAAEGCLGKSSQQVLRRCCSQHSASSACRQQRAGGVRRAGPAGDRPEHSQPRGDAAGHSAPGLCRERPCTKRRWAGHSKPALQRKL